MRYFQKQPPDVFCKRRCFEKLQNSTETNLCWSLFLTLLKKSFLMRIAKFLRSPILKDIWERLLLHYWNPNVIYALVENFIFSLRIFFSSLNRLTHFSRVSHFYIPCKRQKTKGFLTFSGGIEMWHSSKID